jgi:hypothetical protein
MALATIVLVIAIYCSFTAIESLIVDLVYQDNRNVGYRFWFLTISCVLWGVFYQLNN